MNGGFAMSDSERWQNLGEPGRYRQRKRFGVSAGDFALIAWAFTLVLFFSGLFVFFMLPACERKKEEATNTRLLELRAKHSAAEYELKANPYGSPAWEKARRDYLQAAHEHNGILDARPTWNLPRLETTASNR
jgi:hypothetical protein